MKNFKSLNRNINKIRSFDSFKVDKINHNLDFNFSFDKRSHRQIFQLNRNSGSGYAINSSDWIHLQLCDDVGGAWPLTFR